MSRPHDVEFVQRPFLIALTLELQFQSLQGQWTVCEEQRGLRLKPLRAHADHGSVRRAGADRKALMTLHTDRRRYERPVAADLDHVAVAGGEYHLGQRGKLAVSDALLPKKHECLGFQSGRFGVELSRSL